MTKRPSRRPDSEQGATRAGAPVGEEPRRPSPSYRQEGGHERDTPAHECDARDPASTRHRATVTRVQASSVRASGTRHQLKGGRGRARLDCPAVRVSPPTKFPWGGTIRRLPGRAVATRSHVDTVATGSHVWRVRSTFYCARGLSVYPQA